MDWKKYLKESVVLATKTPLLKNVVLVTREYIETLDIPEEEKNKLINYITDDIYVRNVYPEDIENYVKDIMLKIGMEWNGKRKTCK